MRFLVNIRLIYIIIAINILFYAVTTIMAQTYNVNENVILYVFGADVTALILQGEIWRSVASSFLHGGLIHLVFNVYALYVLGTYIERFFGAKKLFTVYILTSVGASLVSLISEVIGVWYANGVVDGLSISIGASGAVFGMIGLLIGNKGKRQTYEPGLDIDVNQLYVIVFYNLLVGFGFNMAGGFVGINNWAHIGGLITGIILGLFFDSINTFYQSKPKKYIEWILIIVAVLLYIYSVSAQLVFIYSNLFV